MRDEDFRRGVTQVSITPGRQGEAFQASASVTLWRSVVLSDFRIVADSERDAVIWTRQEADGHRVPAPPPAVIPWAAASETILKAYRRHRTH